MRWVEVPCKAVGSDKILPVFYEYSANQTWYHNDLIKWFDQHWDLFRWIYEDSAHYPNVVMRDFPQDLKIELTAVQNNRFMGEASHIRLIDGCNLKDQVSYVYASDKFPQGVYYNYVPGESKYLIASNNIEAFALARVCQLELDGPEGSTAAFIRYANGEEKQITF